MSEAMDIYLDSDAQCVYPQALQAAQWYALDLYIVTKDYLPEAANVHLILMQEGQKNGGAWIVGNIARGDICVTVDAELASGCMLRGAVALSLTGRQWGVDVLREGARGAPEAGPSNPRGFAQRLETTILANRGTFLRGVAPVRDFVRPVAARPPLRRASQPFHAEVIRGGV
jgi:hypothetical protein